MRPILAGFACDSAIAWRGGEILTAGAALHAARSLDRALPPSRYAVNVCESLDHFLVATLAALVGARTLILPGGRLPRTLSELRARYPDSVLIGDRAAAIAEVTALVDPWIAAARRERAAAAAAWPALAVDHPAAILFTSGSTGAAQAHQKSWGELVDGAAALMRSIEERSLDGATILGTLPPQHMFGFEATVMLPLQSGTPVLAERPLFAADLADLLVHARRHDRTGVVLITTPLQLRAFHREYPALRGIKNVIASTMPLEPDLARAIERDWQTTVSEVYGCTECGIVAVRRASVSTHWTPAAGVSVRIAADGRAEASGGHLRDTLTLADRLRPAGADGRFELVGRDADIVKIAGKRASLTGLTRELCAIPGVRDGVAFLPRPDARRIAALVVAPEADVDSLRRQLALRVDAAFLPRPLVLVDALPRDPIGKLPMTALCAALARKRTPPAPRRTLTGHTEFRRDHPALSGHFPGRPIVPGVLLLSAVVEMLRTAGLRVVECAKAKFLAPVLPNQTLDIQIDVDANCDVSFEIVIAGRLAAAGSMRCVGEGNRA